MRLPRYLSILTLVLLTLSKQAAAAELRIAVAANFSHAAKALAESFQASSGHHVKLSIGSTGKHYAQIIHGAPFDAFFAADAKRPQLLDEAGIALSGSRFTYALGRLVLWSPRENFVDPNGDILVSNRFRHLAIANPKLAPYGKAAQQVLQKRQLWNKLIKKMVRGENIGQAFQFVKSGNAELGFVAWSQITHAGQKPRGSYWNPPLDLYPLIEQQAVQLRDNAASRAFMEFVRSDSGKQIIIKHGYADPEGSGQ